MTGTEHATTAPPDGLRDGLEPAHQMGLRGVGATAIG
jgi:hypothetical protein